MRPFGTVTEVGSAVTGLSVGDKVIIPAITNCGSCGYCTRGMPAHCQQAGGIGWIFGHLINGLQAEYARVPFAGSSLVKVPAGMSDEQPEQFATHRFKLSDINDAYDVFGNAAKHQAIKVVLTA